MQLVNSPLFSEMAGDGRQLARVMFSRRFSSVLPSSSPLSPRSLRASAGARCQPRPLSSTYIIVAIRTVHVSTALLDIFFDRPCLNGGENERPHPSPS